MGHKSMGSGRSFVHLLACLPSVKHNFSLLRQAAGMISRICRALRGLGFDPGGLQIWRAYGAERSDPRIEAKSSAFTGGAVMKFPAATPGF